VELPRPQPVIARNSVEAQQSGMVLGVPSQVDGNCRPGHRPWARPWCRWSRPVISELPVFAE